MAKVREGIDEADLLAGKIIEIGSAISQRVNRGNGYGQLAP